jgi:hypothetical protein
MNTRGAGKTALNLTTALFLCVVFSSFMRLIAQGRGGSITGRILWSDGRPVEGVRVAAVSTSGSGAVLAALAETDEAGRYRLEDIPPGDYKVAAGLLGSPTYFPNANNIANGKSIRVTAGQAIANVDTTLTDPPARLERPTPPKLELDPATGAKRRITPLMAAIGRNAPVEEVRALASSADVNAQDIWGWTALMYASLSEDAAVTKELLARGADPHARSRSGQTAVLAHVLAVQTSTHDAISALRLLLAAGADIDAADHAGETALMRAIPGSIPKTDDLWLLLNPPRLGGPEGDDRSPSAVARVNLVAFLKDAGAKSGLKNLQGLTALDLLKTEADSLPGPSAQHEKLRLLLEQPAGPMNLVRVKGTVRASSGEQLALRRFGVDPIRVVANVGADGAVDFPAVVPGVYQVESVPAPLFPVILPFITIPPSDPQNVAIPLQPMHSVRIRATSTNGGAAGTIWLLLARAPSPDTRSAPSGLNLRIPEYMFAALTKGASPHLVQLGGPRGQPDPVRLELSPLGPSVGERGFFYDPQRYSVLTAGADGVFSIFLPEGDYVVAVVGLGRTGFEPFGGMGGGFGFSSGQAPAGFGFGNRGGAGNRRGFESEPVFLPPPQQPASPGSLTSGGADLTTGMFRVNAQSEREILIVMPPL